MSSGAPAVMANTAAAATRITCQPPDLHIPTFGIRPVCLSVRRSLTLRPRRLRAAAFYDASGRSYMQTLLHADALTCRRSYMQTLLHEASYMRLLVHDATGRKARTTHSFLRGPRGRYANL